MILFLFLSLVCVCDGGDARLWLGFSHFIKLWYIVVTSNTNAVGFVRFFVGWVVLFCIFCSRFFCSILNSAQEIYAITYRLLIYPTWD